MISTPSVITKGDISYDLIMEDNMSFVEGTYRIDNGDWHVFIFSKDAIEATRVQVWPLG